ncbi:MAG: tRNA (N6-isopentenyl adenosine(37)-C2)-methylthiotransferase MiaB [Rickettsiales bacterium]|jgi:tRNA-2-methylthio-N6-dimethylallyladenosine synthase|nr:tRNA (N6-isopentenyl adenosine(37)-C2)-methylthiotransferase MiaB [Rickettsiales bacterium]
MKRVFIRTFGCQANFYDSSRIEDMFVANGFGIVDDIQSADVFIMNTCHVRRKAGEKVFSELGRIQEIKDLKIKEGKYLAVVITGCVAKAEGKDIFRRVPAVDAVVSPENQHKIIVIVDKIFRKFEQGESETILAIENLAKENKFALLPPRGKTSGVSEMLVVQDGCDKFCSYCTVPFTRGREYSRPFGEVLREANHLVECGAREITLLGQNIDSYCGLNRHGVRTSLGDLILAINDINGIERIRYLTSYPSQFGDDMIRIHRDLPKLMPLVYIPIQSGSNNVLRSMNRKYTREQYLELIQKIRESSGKIEFSSDFIVGFPGETEADFEATLDLVEKVGYALAFSFKYSPRPNTVATRMANHIPEEEKTKRLEKLQAILNRQRLDFNGKFVGKVVDVLVENALRSDEKFFGKTPYSQPVVFSAESPPENGNVLKVKIDDATIRTLRGKLWEG